MKCKVYVWIFVLHSLSHRNSQGLSELIASVTNVLVKPLDLAFASLAQLLLVTSATVSISINQFQFWRIVLIKTVISCSKELVRLVYFCLVHNVLVYWCITSLRGSVGIGIGNSCG